MRSIASQALTLPIEGKIQVPSNRLPVGNVEITLNGDQFVTLTRADGSFTFYDVPTGSPFYFQLILQLFILNFQLFI
jgi:hypothetical protein